MKITACLSETGRQVNAANDADWAEVYCFPKRRRPALYCPDVGNGCRTKLVACERRNTRRGTITRYFAFVGDGGRCGHAAVGKGVEILDPAAVKHPQAAGESDEHLWLKNRVVEIAAAAKYVAMQEHEVTAGVRADVYIEGAQQARRVEVQRVATDIPARTERHPDVVWLLREAHSTGSGNKAALWGNPCVQLRIRAPRIVNGERKWVAAEPWSGPHWADAQVSASSTVLLLARMNTGEPIFDTRPIDLSLFLRQVWSGKRRWYPKGQAHQKFSGWALVSDVETFTEWHRQRRERLRAAAAAARFRPPPPPAPVSPPVEAAPVACRPTATAALPIRRPDRAAAPAGGPVRQEPPRRGLWAYVRALLDL